jgi:hypothetical protein
MLLGLSRLHKKVTVTAVRIQRIKQTDRALLLYLNFKEKHEIQDPARGQVDISNLLGLKGECRRTRRKEVRLVLVK